MLTTQNTICNTWFERDRANVELTTLDGSIIIDLWDEDVAEFVEDGWKTHRQTWHEALA